MRIAYVAGFFKHVLPELQKDLTAHLDSGAVVWIPPFGRTDELNVNRLKGDFLGTVSRDVEEVLICLFYMRGKDHLLDTVKAIIDRGKSQSPKLNVILKTFQSARDSAGVIAAITSFEPNMKTQTPETLRDLEVWISNHHAERVILHPRAVGASKESPYEDVSLVYAAIDSLGKEYWSMRMSSPAEAAKNRESWDAKLQKLGLGLSPAISPAKGKKHDDEYQVSYPVGTKNKRLLEDHLTKGVDRDQRNCLRIYFFWDHQNKKVVIGWLTSHLETDAS